MNHARLHRPTGRAAVTLVFLAWFALVTGLVVAPTAAAATTVVGSTPKISDTTPQVGQTLTAKPGAWTPADVTLSYQWYRGTTKIAGAVASTYDVAPADLGLKLKVLVTGSMDGYTSASKYSAVTSTVAKGAFTTKPAPTISVPNPVVGTVLDVTVGAWAPTPTTFSYQWYRVSSSGSASTISGATASTYLVKAADKSYRLKVKVTAQRSGFASASMTSSLSAAVQPAPASLVNDVRIGSFNLYGQNNDASVSGDRLWANRMPVAAEQIGREKLDVVGLQEASPTTDQAGQLVTALNGAGGSYAAVASSTFSNSDKIIYESTRVVPTASGVFRYSQQADTSQYKQRFLVWATFRSLSSGKEFFFANTHLDPTSAKNSTDTIKVAQWRELIATIPQLNTAKLPVVVVGDFNTSKFWSESQQMLPAMKAAGFGDVLNQAYQVNPPVGIRAETVINGWINSYNGFRTDISLYSYSTSRTKIGNNIDWIFATNSLQVKQWKTVIDFDSATLTVTGVIPSDHNLVTATLVI